MTISSAQALLDFIGTDSISSIDNLRNCFYQFKKICSCQKTKKRQKSEECNNLYIQTVNELAINVSYLKTKTPDAEIVFSHSGGHVIKKVSLL